MIPNVLVQLQPNSPNLTKTPAFKRQVQFFFPLKNATADGSRPLGAGPTTSYSGLPSSSPLRPVQPGCSNGDGMPNRWMRPKPLCITHMVA